MLAAAFVFWLLGFVLFWRAPGVGEASSDRGSVSVIVPARDEAGRIGRLLESLTRQTLRPLEVIVVDDQSRDGTAACARRAGAQVLRGEALPPGWTGKSWSCWQGARLAKGDRLLFLDADTWLEPEAIGRLAAAHVERGGLLSVQPYHWMDTACERLGAIFNLVTLIGTGAFTVFGSRIRSRSAFGPCVMVERLAYLEVRGHARARGAVVEGPALARAFADGGHGVHNLVGRGAVAFRMFPDGAKAMTDGHARSFASGAGSAPPWLTLAIVAWLVGGITTTRHLLVGVLGSGPVPPAALVLAALYALQLRTMLSRIGNFGWWPAICFPIPIVYFIGVFSLSLFRTLVRGRVSWKGRSVGAK